MQVDDAARRAYDVINTIVAQLGYEDRINYPYVALRLSDGGSDGKNYATKIEAVRHQLSEQQCAYFSFRHAPNGFSTHAHAALYLAWHRQAYDNGFRLVDPDGSAGGPDLIMPDMREHLTNQMSRLGIKGRR